MPLTPNQLQAINHTAGNLQLIACAGSGKTEVVARRVTELLKCGRAKPRNIVAFTFTEKAAAELKERIHAYCLDLLKTEVPKYLKYDILNEVQQRLFIDRNSKKSGLTNCTDLNGKQLERYKDTSVYISATRPFTTLY